MTIFRRRNDDEEEDGYKKRRVCKIGAAATAVVSVIALILTEDFTLPMRLIDKYTILMIVILALCVVSMMLYRFLRQDQEEVSGE